jgi:hypothetical protein
VIYAPPTVEDREPIGTAFVLGNTYTLSPTWTDGEYEEQA